MKRTSIFLCLAVALPALLAGCGGSSGPSNSIRVTMTDFAYSPNAFTVPAGQQISIEITNTGAVQHSFVIMKAGVKVQGHFTEADKANIFWEQAAIPSGESSKQVFTAPEEPGEYQVLCSNAGHLEAGMVAKLIVVKQP